MLGYVLYQRDLKPMYIYAVISPSFYEAKEGERTLIRRVELERVMDGIVRKIALSHQLNLREKCSSY